MVPSIRETVRLGVYDANLAPILAIGSGDETAAWGPSGHLECRCAGQPVVCQKKRKSRPCTLTWLSWFLITSDQNDGPHDGRL